jgi:hypothetical protein
MNDTHYEIHGVNGPVVTVTGGRGLAMQDMVRVGDWNLTGEVVRVEDGVATVQVYEDTTGLAPGQQVTSMGGPHRPAPHHRAARHRHPVPHRQGRRRRHPRAASAPARP